MRKLGCFLGVVALLLAARGAWAEGEQVRKIVSLDADWKFTQGDPAGAEKPEFDDSAWRKVDVPHDWSIEGAIDTKNPSGTAGAFLPMGVGWYRKVLPPLAPGQTSIEFDGVMMDSTVYFNGQKLGERPNGYSTFRYPIMNGPDGKNIIAVRVDNSAQPSSRWYAGSGITRHVRLIASNGLGGTFIRTLKADETSATLRVQSAVSNPNPVAREFQRPEPPETQFAPQVPNRNRYSPDLDIEVLSPDGTRAAVARVPGKHLDRDFVSEDYSCDITINHPRLWGVDGGNKSPLYHVIIRAAGDEESIAFGIRTAEFKAETGFWLNGKNIKLQGVCLHLDGGGVGAAVPMGVWERRLDALRSLGVNAIRTSHNPPDPAFLDLLDRKGFLVMHEIFDVWNTAKVRGDYARFFKDNWQRDLTDAVTRDRNHPCIVIYSAGNEIHDAAAQQVALFPQLRDLYHQLDPTRPVTMGMLQADRAGNGFSNGLMQLQDVVGANYRGAQLVTLARANPGMKVIETETNYNAGTLATLRDNPELAGEFLWTGVDYLGEGMGGISQGFGMVDRTGAIRARGYEHQAWWTTEPMVKIARVVGPTRTNNRDIGGGRVCDWTPSNLVASTMAAQNQTVEVYSNCDDVELYVNGAFIGSNPKPANVTRTWQVPYSPGTLKAVAKNKGIAVASDELKTAGKPTKVLLTADQKTLTTAWDDVVYVRANITDDLGTTNPNAGNLVKFEITGPGTIMAVDNADLDSHESFRGNQRSAYAGTCIAVIKATGAGPITVKATADGLTGGSATIFGVAK